MQSKKQDRAKLLQMVTQWQNSGLTQKAFCTTNKIAYHTFHYWYGVYRSDQKATGSFLPVTVIPNEIPEQITLTSPGGIQVRFFVTKQSCARNTLGQFGDQNK